MGESRGRRQHRQLETHRDVIKRLLTGWAPIWVDGVGCYGWETIDGAYDEMGVYENALVMRMLNEIYRLDERTEPCQVEPVSPSVHASSASRSSSTGTGAVPTVAAPPANSAALPASPAPTAG